MDATAGNGHDTVFFANLVGESGHVFAFDIQQEAVDATMKQLLENDLIHRVTVVKDGHEHVAHHVQNEIAGAIFNLGYLPGSDHSIVTTPNTTLEAIDQILKPIKNWRNHRFSRLSWTCWWQRRARRIN